MPSKEENLRQEYVPLLIHTISVCFLFCFPGSGKTLAFAIPMIHTVLQWQVKKKPAPALSSTGAPPGETGNEPGAENPSPGRAGALPDEIGIEGEALSSEVGAKAGTPPSQAETMTGAAPSEQGLLSCDDDVDAGEGPSSLIREKPIPEQEENQVEKHDEEQTGKLKQELGGSIAPPKRPLLGLVLTPTRELAVQVKQHVDAVAKFTSEV